jgi:hypothetical protein
MDESNYSSYVLSLLSKINALNIFHKPMNFSSNSIYNIVFNYYHHQILYIIIRFSLILLKILLDVQLFICDIIL